MEVKKPIFSIYLDPRIEKDGKLFAVKLRITFQRVRNYIYLGYDLTEAEFKKMLSGSTRNNDVLREKKLFNTAILSKAQIIADSLEEFNFPQFKKLFLETSQEKERKNKKSGDVFYAMQEYIQLLEKAGRINTASSYKTALNSLKEFKSKLSFQEINSEFLSQYESFMLKNSRSLTTIGIYLRNLRTMVNKAIDEGIIDKNAYPFKKSRYQIPSGQNIKKALSLKDIEKIFNYPAEPNSLTERARDFWVFSYLNNGINIKDICRLKYSNLDGNKLTFVRSKTERANRGKQKTVQIILHPKASEIIEKWGNPNKLKENFIFEILPNNIDPKRELALIQYFTKSINKYMSRIAADLGLENITSYSARHSFATVLKRSGVSTEYISEALAHNSLKTTENYLDSFEDETKKEISKILTQF